MIRIIEIIMSIHDGLHFSFSSKKNNLQFILPITIVYTKENSFLLELPSFELAFNFLLKFTLSFAESLPILRLAICEFRQLKSPTTRERRDLRGDPGGCAEQTAQTPLS